MNVLSNNYVPTLAAATGSGEGASIVTVLLAYLGILLVFAIVWYILQVIAYWKIFSKAGEAGWKSLIPLYNDYVMFKVTWKPMYFWITLGLIVLGTIFSAVGGGAMDALGGICSLAIVIIYGILFQNRLSRAFGHGVGFTLGLIFLGPIFRLILGFGGDQYEGNSSDMIQYSWGERTLAQLYEI